MKKMLFVVMVMMVVLSGCTLFQQKHNIYSVEREVILQADGKEQMKRAMDFIVVWTDRKVLFLDDNNIVTEPTKLLACGDVTYGRLQYVIRKEGKKITIKINTASKLSLREAELNSLILQDYMETGKMRVAVKYITVW